MSTKTATTYTCSSIQHANIKLAGQQQVQVQQKFDPSTPLRSVLIPLPTKQSGNIMTRPAKLTTVLSRKRTFTNETFSSIEEQDVDVKNLKATCYFSTTILLYKMQQNLWFEFPCPFRYIRAAHFTSSPIHFTVLSSFYLYAHMLDACAASARLRNNLYYLSDALNM